MQRFSDPELIHGLSNSELMQGALITSLMGMGTTFVILVLLWGIIASISKVIQSTEKKAITLSQPSAPVSTASVSAPKTAEPVAIAATDAGSELVAVITAAIAAMEGTTSTSGLIIRKISRISGNSTAWSRAGSSEVIDSRKF